MPDDEINRNVDPKLPTGTPQDLLTRVLTKFFVVVICLVLASILIICSIAAIYHIIKWAF